MFYTKLMSAIENAVNGGVLGSQSKRVRCVNDFLANAHRYLQSEFFNFIVNYIQINAVHYKKEPNRWFDGRNEYVGMICEKICDNIEGMQITQIQEEMLTGNESTFKGYPSKIFCIDETEED